MSTSVNIYSVPVAQLRALPGSKDKRLLDLLRENPETFELPLDDFEDEDEEEKPPSGPEAVGQILRGEPMDENFGFVYGYAYEALCGVIGVAVEPTWTGIARFCDWFQQIDQTLGLLGVPVKIMDLCYRGCLIDIPRPDDFPGMGWWTAEELAKAAEVFQNLDVQKLDTKTQRKVQPMLPVLEQIRQWIDTGAGRRGDWLIGIHS
jgi:hypothetical protein